MFTARYGLDLYTYLRRTLVFRPSHDSEDYLLESKYGSPGSTRGQSPCHLWQTDGSVTAFSPNISVSPSQHHPTIAPYSSLSTRCSYQKDNRAKAGNLPRINPISEIQKNCEGNLFNAFRT